MRHKKRIAFQKVKNIKKKEFSSVFLLNFDKNKKYGKAMQSSKKETLKETPMIQQYQEIKSRYPDFILFFRLGDFYEMFEEDAKEAAGILGIALTHRGGRLMCGFPYHAKDNYLFKLVKANKKVAICEQVEEPGKSKLVKREVKELVTPGTFTDENHLAKHSHSFLASFFIEGDEMALAFADASTGKLVLVKENYDIQRLASLIHAFKPVEILLLQTKKELNPLLSSFFTTTLPSYYFSPAMNEPLLLEHFKVGTLKGLGLADPLLAGACGAVLRYLKENLFQEIHHLKELEILRSQAFIYLPESTLKNLEILEPLFKSGPDSSLFYCLHHTKTAMGSRELRHWLSYPLRNQEAIQNRLNKVEFFVKDEALLNKTQEILKEIPDLERILSKIALKKAGPRDLNYFRTGLKSLKKLKALNLNPNLFPLPPSLSALIQEIDRVLAPNPPIDFEEGGVILKGVDKQLDYYKNLSTKGKELLLEIEKQEKENTGINSLKLRYNKVSGYYIEVPKTQLKLVPNHYMRKQSLVAAERFTMDKLIAHETEILESKDKVKILEKELFDKLCLFCLEYLNILKENLEFVKNIDVLSCFAFLALHRNYTKPILSIENNLIIQEGRHPVVEQFVDEFMSNSLCLNQEDNRLLLITGPNMAGKSTFLRQTALIALLAHVGSFVPAKKVEVGLIDQIFTRIGASDNLAGGESTFLVEMNETSQILRCATPQSLIIMDEIGRGTATYDGLSLAWAIVEYLAHPEVIRGKTLFATHYHELTLLGQEKGIKNYRMAVREWNQEIVFLHRVEEGAADKSYGIHVAEIAGIPPAVILRAKEILSGMEITFLNNEEHLLKPKQKEREGSLFTLPHDPFLKTKSQILSLDIKQTTPIQALLFLEQIQNQLKHHKD